jgi:hypothetical protein
VRHVARGLAAVLVAALAGSSGETAANQSIYTSVRRSDCRPPPREIAAAFEARGLGVQECPAPSGWRLLMVASDTNTWIEVRSNTLTWSSEEAIVYDEPIGLFPTAGASPTVEWRRRPDGGPVALVFRVSAQPGPSPTQRISRLFVVRLERNLACLLGRVRTNALARSLADSTSGCGSGRR